MTESVDLNNLTIKTDSLPDNWKMLLIDPVTLQPAQNITVARFIELLTTKIPVATTRSKGLKGIFDIIMETDSFMGSINPDIIRDNTIKFISMLSPLDNANHDFGLLVTLNAEGGNYVHQLFLSNGPNMYKRFYSTNNSVWSSWGRFSFYQPTLATSNNALTNTISDSCSFAPPPPQIACQTIQNQPVRSSNLRILLYWIPTARMVQLQLNLNHRRKSTCGRLTRLVKLSWNYKTKTNNLNKSSLTMASRYRSNNLPRAGPPRLN